MQALIGNVLDRCITDAGYRGHNAPPDHQFKVYTSGQKRRVTLQIKREDALPSSPSSATSRNTTAWAAITSPCQRRCHQCPARRRRLQPRRLLAWLRFLLLRIRIALGLAAQFKLA
jgi:transposase, IS5 family